MGEFNFCGASYTAGTLNSDAQQSMNLYPELVESGTGKNKMTLYGTPGLTLLGTLATGPVRGLWPGGAPLTTGGRLFAVGGSVLYEVFADGSSTALGDVGNDGKPVQMLPNGTQLGIISDGLFWLADGLTVVNPTFTGTSDPVTAQTGAFLDGYFIVAKPDSKQINISALDDGTQWDPLDFAIKEGYPDNIGAILADHEDLWIFGETTTEVWRDDGNPDFPLSRDPGAFIHQGTAAIFSSTRLSNGVAWVGGDTRGKATAWRAQGYVPIRVSTHAIEAAWEGYSVVSDAISWTQTYRGHQFWWITFPTAGHTWVYDATLNLWHERGFWGGSSNGRHKANCHAYVFNEHLVGDYANGNIYVLDAAAYTDNGTAIHWSRTAPHISDDNNYSFFHRFRLDAENSGALNPSLSWSKDGGHTFNSPITTASQSADDALARYDWRRLGRSRDRVFRVTGSAAVKTALINAWLE